MSTPNSAGYPAMYEPLPHDLDVIDVTTMIDSERRLYLADRNGSWSAFGMITDLVDRFGPVLRRRIATATGKLGPLHLTEPTRIGPLLCGPLVRSARNGQAS